LKSGSQVVISVKSGFCNFKSGLLIPYKMKTYHILNGDCLVDQLKQHLPLLNIADNPGAMDELRKLGDECKKIGGE